MFWYICYVFPCFFILVTLSTPFIVCKHGLFVKNCVDFFPGKVFQKVFKRYVSSVFRTTPWPPQGQAVKYRNRVRGLVLCEVCLSWWCSCCRLGSRHSTHLHAPHARCNGVFGHEHTFHFCFVCRLPGCYLGS